LAIRQRARRVPERGGATCREPLDKLAMRVSAVELDQRFECGSREVWVARVDDQPFQWLPRAADVSPGERAYRDHPALDQRMPERPEEPVLERRSRR
jgi:hypothetical protein